MLENDVLVIFQFLNLLGIQTEGMNTIKAQKDQLILTRKDENGMSNAIQTITVQLHKDSNCIDIKKHTQVKYDFQPIQNGGYAYQVVDNQALFQLETKEEKLNLYTATVTQNTSENTLGYQSGIIVEFDNVFDVTQNQNKVRIVQLNQSSIDTEKTSYSVPQGYKITDGTTNISDNETKAK